MLSSHTRQVPRWLDPTIALVLTLAALVLLASTLPGIDMGGDAAWKWAFVRLWRIGRPWTFDHHTVRFGVNVPIYLSQLLFGARPNTMYVAPIGVALLQIPFVYAIGRRVSSRAVGVAASLLLLTFAPWAMAATQLLPGVFQSSYLVLALYAFCRFVSERERAWLVALGAALFVAYLAMVSTLYLLPGFALATFCVRRRVCDVLIWLAVLLGAFALETALYRIFTPYPWGQLQIALRTHDNVAPIQFWDLFRRYSVLTPAWQWALAGGALAALLLLVLARNSALRGLPIIAGVFLLGSTFGIKHIDPLVPALNFRDRYFDPLAPLLALMIPASLVALTNAWRARSGWTSRRWELAAADQLVLAILLSALVTSAVISQRGFSMTRVLAHNDASYQLFTRAFLTGLPIVGNNARDHDQVKTLIVVSYVFYDDEAFLAQADPGRPRLYRLKVRRRSYRFLARSQLAPEQVERAIRGSSCAVFAARPPGEPRLIVREGTACASPPQR